MSNQNRSLELTAEERKYIMEHNPAMLDGILAGREGTTVTLETENGSVSFEVNAASSVQLCDDEDLFD